MLGFVSLVVSASILFTSVDSLKCFHCDLAKNITCPGWDRWGWMSGNGLFFMIDTCEQLLLKGEGSKKFTSSEVNFLAWNLNLLICKFKDSTWSNPSPHSNWLPI